VLLMLPSSIADASIFHCDDAHSHLHLPMIPSSTVMMLASSILS
jgi:hypothetical protein